MNSKASSKHSKVSALSGVQEKFRGSIDKVGNVKADKTGNMIIKVPASGLNHVGNEVVTMKIMSLMGVETPEVTTGLFNGKTVYAVKRFDIDSDGNKVGVSDLCSLAGLQSRDKYAMSYLDASAFIPKSEHVEFFKRIFSSYLVGNSDLHLKNISLFNESGKLTPAYDVLNINVLDSDVSGELGFEPELYQDMSVDHNVNKDHFDEFAKRLGISVNDRDNVYSDCFRGLKTGVSEIKSSHLLTDEDKNNYVVFCKRKIDQFFKSSSHGIVIDGGSGSSGGNIRSIRIGKTASEATACRCGRNLRGARRKKHGVCSVCDPKYNE